MSGLELVAAAIGAAGSVASGIAANNEAKFQAKQQEMQGNEEFAASQRDADQKRQEAQLVNSRAQALAAYSGAGAADPTIIKLMTGTTQQGEMNAQTSLYGGENRKRGLFDQANATRLSGQSSMFGSFLSAAGGLASGFGKYRQATAKTSTYG
jgi:hypothetical protein